MAGDAVDLDSRMSAFMQMCREAGVKATHQRREVFREVARTEEHPDAETIYRRVRERIPTISLDTVYRTLSLLEQKGLLTRLELFSNRTRYDANMDSHHHFICTECGRVRDFSSEKMNTLATPKEVSSWGDIRSAHVQLRGVCAACLGRRGRASGRQ